jgi:RNA polymerase sigma-70 factor (ECF subfamily)
LRRNGFHTCQLTDDCCSLADRTSHAETEIVVRQALSRLPAGQRTAVVAVDMYGYSVADAAALLGIAEGTVKSRCARARARLAVLLGHLSPSGHA